MIRYCRQIIFGLLAAMPSAWYGTSAMAEDAVVDVPRPETQELAARLQQATITLRFVDNEPAGGADAPRRERITVATGVSLGDGRAVTFSQVKPGSRCRATLPDGEQASAEVRVVDEYSGLVLLEISGGKLPGLEVAPKLPPLGASVMTAAAAGIEQPTVSLGIVAGSERSLPGSGLPTLLQCDLRTTGTSSGAAIVDTHGRLIGLIAVTAAAQDSDGWTYAVPTTHVQRLLRASAQSEGQDSREAVVLKRQRPTVGLTLGPSAKEDTVCVEHVTAGGPAEQAGIQTGDLVLRTEGRRIRSAYQAVSQILKKQPGEVVEFLVERDGRQQTIAVTLQDAGGAAVAGGIKVGPQLTVRSTGRGQIEVQNGPRVADLDAQPQPDKPAVAAGGRLPRDEATLLRVQIDAFARVIERLQAELARRDEAQRDTNELIKSLTEEVGQLRKQLEKAPPESE
ncbi:MAG: S1C family serine protease [Pirellulales bacterium]